LPGVSLGGSEAHKIECEFAVRIHNNVTASAEPASYEWYVKNSGSSAGSTPQDQHGRSLNDVEGLLAYVADDSAGATLHVDFATGPWKTLIINNVQGSSSISTGQDAYLASEAFETNGQTRVVFGVVSNPQSRTNSQVISAIAVTTSGKEIRGYIASSTSTDKARIMEIAVPVAKRDIKEIQLQTRPWNKWIEIRHIALHPDHKTQVQIVTSDGPDASAR
ncbi:MAG TPA: hypothetical protein VG722_04750, partial [Tepidisphaeraceae bacterium]|nr:hypothetical protein [Tepidisphaeraceae bacterium]